MALAVLGFLWTPNRDGDGRVLSVLGNIILLLIGVIPFLILVIAANVLKDRGAADLKIADDCIDWSHLPKPAQGQMSPEFIARCVTYFKVRSERDIEEDDRRWAARNSDHP
jgi:hypothetical protein